MERGEGSSSGGRPKKSQYIKETEIISYEQSVVQLSKEGRKTYLVVERKRKRQFNTVPGTYSTLFDNAYPQYKWLHKGWIVEERRIMLTGRLYRYYYDPRGKAYYFRYKVEQICAGVDKNLGKKKVCIVID